MHLPVVMNAQGEKLSKQTHAIPADAEFPASNLFKALVFLGQDPPAQLRLGEIKDILAWAIANWHPEKILGQAQLWSRNSPIQCLDPDL